ncbi:hypothetical protein FZI85_05510 [Mycobacterium sp. CBMA293]|uniref:hypothetical protein n=1 Tax=unclassified Mycolicibacterium TaxID=2636767 RepID=UPI0012DFC32C|nr:MULTISPECIES: hypothetical protein [unclassified Mycolicibacterium]MUL48741.1 hypothetical protein [Mycolicibacterium sp. CBMA 360]MUL62195.1 hypothetical protein [Mycolicibacterium sp. CBMA 335]MUL71656.1 hypothetical protein [Mycolicibacterium sp. CBMA 311]MUL93611.1 hypothetical protein [Mycolicibacterium sp. CBMA 230]MUM09292.1 hypothetical protein [Mycolicibacterium sp. CBMA 213]
MHITPKRIVPLAATAAAALAIVTAPAAAAATYAPGSTVTQTNGNAQIVASPGPAAQEAGQLQQPFGGDYGFLLFRNH